MNAADPTLIHDRRSGLRYAVEGTVAILVVLAVAHGLALWDGVILDDHWHQKGLREHAWSWHGILRTLNIAPADFLHCWWQRVDVQWDYLRPFFILCMKVVYLFIGGSNPVALHAFSLLLHAAAALLVWRLAWLLTRDRLWSFVGALLFVIYPHAVISVAWPSSQNVVLQTTLILGSLLAYIRASGLPVGRFEDRPTAAAPPPALRRGFFALALGLWLLAILTRENAVLMPAIFLAFDGCFGGRLHVWARRYAYGLFFVIGAAFAAWRISLEIPPLPEVYCRHYDGDPFEFAAWLAAKFLHYLYASIWLSPMTVGPSGRFNPWLETTGDCVLMIVMVVLLLIGYAIATRRTRGAWIWPFWIALFLLPVTAVVATPHSGYMSGIGFAIGVSVAAAAAFRAGSRRAAGITACAAGALVLIATFMTGASRLQWMGVAAAERYFAEWLMISPPNRNVRHVFFINLPFVDIYGKPQLDRRIGPWFEKVEAHALTFAPRPIRMDRPAIVEQLNQRTLSVEILGDRYFSGFVGRFLVEGFRGGGPFETGETIATDEFDVTILDADESGVGKLQFVFRRPLSDPAYAFYMTTPSCGAVRLRFPLCRATGRPLDDVAPLRSCEAVDLAAGAMDGGDSAAAMPLFATACSDGEQAARHAAAALLPICRLMAETSGAPCQTALTAENPTADQWRTVCDWWAWCVTDEMIRDVWLRRNDFEDLVWLRSEIEFDRHLAGLLIRSDLYLSGPPFAGPRR